MSNIINELEQKIDQIRIITLPLLNIPENVHCNFSTLQCVIQITIFAEFKDNIYKFKYFLKGTNLQ